MSTSQVIAGAIAFVGPASRECFSYLSVIKVQGSSALVRITGPDASDSSPEFDIKTSIIRHRIVDEAETELWPGSYVGHQIAFVQPARDSIDQWTYGHVTGYNKDGGSANLHIRTDQHSHQLKLTGPSTVIAVGRLNYVLCTGAAVNVMVLNALELVDRQNEVIVACGKSRLGLPASVITTMFSVRSVPEERIPLIRPDTLEVVNIRRQHSVDCELAGRGNDPSEVFNDPVATDNDDVKARTNLRPLLTNNVDLTFSDSDDEGKRDSMPTQQADIEMVRLHTCPLQKRARVATPSHQDLLLPDDIDVPVLGNCSDAHKSAFRPSEIEQYVHNTIAHPSLIGKQAQVVFVSSQQGPRTKFLGTPFVLSLSYDLSFGIRGLSLMHFRRFFQELEQQAAVDAVNMTNFGRFNALQPAIPPSKIDEIVDAFKTLLYFAKGFYNSTVYSFIEAGDGFMEQPRAHHQSLNAATTSTEPKSINGSSGTTCYAAEARQQVHLHALLVEERMHQSSSGYTL
ncbi:hypothetical protein ON010_g8910 [Phytophthora cinnamomi]|nr:hypothetical protein ON010_g8910 [Phytophthora cinnamomi]